MVHTDMKSKDKDFWKGMTYPLEPCPGIVAYWLYWMYSMAWEELVVLHVENLLLPANMSIIYSLPAPRLRVLYVSNQSQVVQNTWRRALVSTNWTELMPAEDYSRKLCFGCWIEWKVWGIQVPERGWDSDYLLSGRGAVPYVYNYWGFRC